MSLLEDNRSNMDPEQSSLFKNDLDIKEKRRSKSIKFVPTYKKKK
jgi:hypothetical protein